MRSRRYRVAGVAVAGMLVLTGCGGDDDPTAEGPDGGGGGEEGGAVTVAHCTPQNTFIPTNTNEVCAGDVLDQVTAGLIYYDPDTGAPENDIAESIETEDNKLFTITIKEGIEFDDGEEITADNFVNAWNYGAYGPNAQLSAYFFEPILGYDEVHPAPAEGEEEPPEPTAEELEGMKVVDDYTFTVELAEESSTFPARLGYTAFVPLPDAFFEEGGAEAFGANPIGAGPFDFVSYSPNQEIVIERSETYDRAGESSVARVVYRIVNDYAAAYASLLEGDLDVVNKLPAEALIGAAYQAQLDGNFVQRPTGRFSSISFPPDDVNDAYADPKLRKAISLAIDREKVIEIAYPGTRTPADGWVSPVVGGYTEGQCGDLCTYDADRAQELFDEAGGLDEPITIAYNFDGEHQAWVDATCASIEETLNVECRGQAYPTFAEFRELITNREMETIFRTGWQMDYPSIENFLVPLYATGAGSNDGEYSNPEFDALLQKAASQEDLEKVYATYQKAERLLAEDMPVIPMWFDQEVFGFSDRVSNVNITAFGTYDFSTLTVNE